MYENDQRNNMNNQYSNQMRSNNYPVNSSGPRHHQQQNIGNQYQYGDRYMNGNESNYIEMPQGDHGYEMPHQQQQQQNGFYNQHLQFNHSIVYFFENLQNF